MSRLQKTILKAVFENGGTLPAPKYTLTLSESSAYCGLHNIRAITLKRDYSCTLTNEGRRILANF